MNFEQVCMLGLLVHKELDRLKDRADMNNPHTVDIINDFEEIKEHIAKMYEESKPYKL